MGEKGKKRAEWGGGGCSENGWVTEYFAGPWKPIDLYKWERTVNKVNRAAESRWDQSLGALIAVDQPGENPWGGGAPRCGGGGNFTSRKGVSKPECPRGEIEKFLVKGSRACKNGALKQFSIPSLKEGKLCGSGMLWGLGPGESSKKSSGEPE